MTEDRLLARLSSWVHFVNYPSYVIVHHVLTGEQWEVPLEEARELESFSRFRNVPSSKRYWLERGVFVTPGQDPIVPTAPKTIEAIAHKSWTDWYWTIEAESEREYRWLGQPILKMPDDLFMLQEIMHETRASSVLEIGHGHGGALWFFASVLSLTSGSGHVVGVDWDPPSKLPPFSSLPSVRVDLVNADAHQELAMDKVRALRNQYDLVVIDVDANPLSSVQLLRQWSQLVAPGGTIVLEDVTAPECVVPEVYLSKRLDRFLMENPSFGILPQARRFAVGKSTRAVYRKDGPKIHDDLMRSGVAGALRRML